MWMMGYNEGGELNMNMNMNMNMGGVEAYNNGSSRKLRPLVPRPTPPYHHHHGASSSNRLHPATHDHLLAFNHHLASEQSKREFNSQQVVVSSRWNPTPEQLQTLEELYRRGTRTPSADEIQHITAQLRRYGKIEGKNVFYWFQNHKARERQKRRRGQLELSASHDQTHFPTADFTTININDHQSIARKDSEINRTVYEVEEARNWGIPTNCSTFSEKNVSREITAKAAAMAECRATTADHGWILPVEQEDQGNHDHLLLLHRRRRNCFPERNDTWHHMMQYLSSPPPPSTNHILINPHTNTCTAAATTTSTVSTTKMLPENVSPAGKHHLRHGVDSCQTTLQLFPVEEGHGDGREQMEKCLLYSTDVNASPRQFIEFLPLKN